MRPFFSKTLSSIKRSHFLRTIWLLGLGSLPAIAVVAQRPASVSSRGHDARSSVTSLLSVADLPRFRPVAHVGMFSSYDRTGGNDDGFQGTYSFLRKDPDGGLVIAEVTGPGAITRIWTPEAVIDKPGISTDTIAFYFDGESTARLRVPFNEIFAGTTPPFLAPLSASGAGGHYSYVPLAFAKSIKVVAYTPVFRFYQLNYLQYAPGVKVHSYTPGDRYTAPALDTSGKRMTVHKTIKPGSTVTLFDLHRPGRITAFRLSPSTAFAGDDRGLVLRIYWDGAKRPAVDVPVGDFFGYSFGVPATHSLLLGTDAAAARNYVYLPMPFAKAARIDVVSERRDGAPVELQAEVIVAPNGKRRDEGTFHARWHRENPVPTGNYFQYATLHGRGALVGVTLQAQGFEHNNTGFFEGDDILIVNGDTVAHGTGSEDAFNGGWYNIRGRWDGPHSMPWSGAMEYHVDSARTAGYRVLVGDAYTFSGTLTYMIEHGPAGNQEPADYTGVTFYYLDTPEGAAPPLAPFDARTVQRR